MSIANEKSKEDGRALEGLKKKCGSLKRAADALVESEQLAAIGAKSKAGIDNHIAPPVKKQTKLNAATPQDKSL